MTLDSTRCLPDDGCAGTLLARVWSTQGPVPGPSVAVVRADGVYDLSATFPTMSGLLDLPDAVARVRATPGVRLGSLEDLLAASSQPGAAPGVRRRIAAASPNSKSA